MIKAANIKPQIIALLFVSTILFAQSDDINVQGDAQVDESFPQTDKKTSTATTQTKTQADVKRKERPNSQVFKPSEEISEDVPVAFPVDI